MTSSSIHDLPPGWVEAKDAKTGRTYYANPTTRETRWDPPPARVSASTNTNTNTTTTAAPSLSNNGSSGDNDGAGNFPDESNKNERSSHHHSNHQEKESPSGGGNHHHHHDDRYQPNKRLRPSSSSGSRERGQRSRGRKSRSDSRGASSGTISGLGQSGNLLFTAPDLNEAIREPSKLVPVARAMLDKSAAFPAESTASGLELNSLTAGQVADLCRIQHESDTCGDNVTYTPLNPFRMSRKGNQSHQSQRASKEEGRLDVRLSALKEELSKYESKKKRSDDDNDVRGGFLPP